MKKGNSGVNMAIRLLLLREYLLANAFSKVIASSVHLIRFLKRKNGQSVGLSVTSWRRMLSFSFR